MPDEPVVRLPPLAGRQQESWRAFIEQATPLGDHCLLVGGQMVFLLEVERGSSDARPTDDVDVVIDLRVEPAGLARVHQTLTDAGFDQLLPNTDGVAHRYARGNAMIDVLAPDNLGARARLAIGTGRTIEAPGGSQALMRSGPVDVHLPDGSNARVRRPTLVGALLGKVAAVTQIVSQSSAERAKHMRDVDSLARLMGPTDRDHATLWRPDSSAQPGDPVCFNSGATTGEVVFVNVTPVDATAAGFGTLTVPSEDWQASPNVNFDADQANPNTVVKAADTDGTLCYTTNQLSHVIIDIIGFGDIDIRTPTPDGAAQRAIDTRERQTGPSVEDLRSAPVLSLCDHRPGNLVDGRLLDEFIVPSGIEDYRGWLEILGAHDPVFADITGDGALEAIMVIFCARAHTVYLRRSQKTRSPGQGRSWWGTSSCLR